MWSVQKQNLNSTQNINSARRLQPKDLCKTAEQAALLNKEEQYRIPISHNANTACLYGPMECLKQSTTTPQVFVHALPWPASSCRSEQHPVALPEPWLQAQNAFAGMQHVMLVAYCAIAPAIRLKKAMLKSVRQKAVINCWWSCIKVAIHFDVTQIACWWGHEWPPLWQGSLCSCAVSRDTMHTPFE